jgi:hypothetical protein
LGVGESLAVGPIVESQKARISGEKKLIGQRLGVPLVVEFSAWSGSVH